MKEAPSRQGNRGLLHGVSVRSGSRTRPFPIWKRTLDVCCAAIAIVVLSPILLLIAGAIVIDSPGGALYRHVRVGRDGRTFICWKFRSMSSDADRRLQELKSQNEANGHIFKLKDDPRRTRVGCLLRRTSLDELPQLWNVLRGDMSLVGPRPPLPSEVEAYEPHHHERLAGVPGITGLWQVRARHRHDFEEMVALDTEYLASVRFVTDLKILLLTIPTVLFGRGSY